MSNKDFVYRLLWTVAAVGAMIIFLTRPLWRI